MEIIKAKPTITNITLTLANTEYSYALPEGTKEFWLKLREEGYPLKVAMVLGDSGTTYFIIQNGEVHREENLKGAITLYFQCPASSQTAEIIVFK